MFASIKIRLHDVKTISQLCEAAERQAQAAGLSKPGSEHFVLAALELHDETAKHAFNALAIDSVAFKNAIAGQFIEALASVGVVIAPQSLAADSSSAVAKPSTLYEAEQSGKALMQRIASSASSRAGRLLLGADILIAAADEEFTIAARAFKELGITSEQLSTAAANGIHVWQRSPGGVKLER